MIGSSAPSIPAANPAGHDVVETTDGSQHGNIEEWRNQFVVSDWMMPNLSGVDLCRRIRAAKFEHYVYVILCTSRAEKADLVEGMDAGADDFIGKPIGSEELRVRVRRANAYSVFSTGLHKRIMSSKPSIVISDPRTSL